ncbi:hypothetical protein SAMD00019534_046970, partial [Acytostelium subglobosum LB1]|uniref:hypothetical protein n=1 Tax=Acytostelium subglobosum LB1 TaxID=1410327 RepID=UPI0006448F95
MMEPITEEVEELPNPTIDQSQEQPQQQQLKSSSTTTTLILKNYNHNTSSKDNKDNKENKVNNNNINITKDAILDNYDNNLSSKCTFCQQNIKQIQWIPHMNQCLQLAITISNVDSNINYNNNEYTTKQETEEIRSDIKSLKRKLGEMECGVDPRVLRREDPEYQDCVVEKCLMDPVWSSMKAVIVFGNLHIRLCHAQHFYNDDFVNKFVQSYGNIKPRSMSPSSPRSKNHTCKMCHKQVTGFYYLTNSVFDHKVYMCGLSCIVKSFKTLPNHQHHHTTTPTNNNNNIINNNNNNNNKMNGQQQVPTKMMRSTSPTNMAPAIEVSKPTIIV